MAVSAMSLTSGFGRRVALLVCIFVLLVFIFAAHPSVNLRLLSSSRPGRGWSGTDDQHLHTTERLHFSFEFGGYLFNETGRSHGLKKKVTTCLTHSFSPYIEREAAKRFVDPPHDNIYFANSPAILWYHGELVLVSRIWLDREKYEPKNDWPSNHFADNWLYTQRFDRHLRPVSNGSIIGIPAPKQWWVGDGPIEPRLVAVKDRLFVTFNAAMAFKHEWYMDFTILWDLAENYPIIPQIRGGSPMVNASAKDDMPRDKHWMALVDNDELFFVHNLDPLRVLKCTLEGECHFVHDETKREGLNFKDHVSHLRGGTPFVEYKWPYFVGVAHSTMYKASNRRRFYTAHFVIIRVKPYRIVYVSNDIKIHSQIYQSTPMVRYKYIDDGFVFPVGLIVEDKDTVSIGVHVNDYSSVVIRVRGLEPLFSKVMDIDTRDSPKHGPSVGYIQQHTHDTMEKVAKLQFIH